MTWHLFPVRVVFGLISFLAALALWLDYFRLLASWLDLWPALIIAIVFPIGVIGLPFVVENDWASVLYVGIAAVAIVSGRISHWARNRIRAIKTEY